MNWLRAVCKSVMNAIMRLSWNRVNTGGVDRFIVNINGTEQQVPSDQTSIEWPFQEGSYNNVIVQAEYNGQRGGSASTAFTAPVWSGGGTIPDDISSVSYEFVRWE